MLARPTVSVFNSANANEIVNKVSLPAVCTAPIRLDIVQFVHDQISKNVRQAHGVFIHAGMQHSAESWGPGRAVARVPRISGSGTSRAAQGAFANSCRKGRMFAPLKTWRRWHRKVNIKQKRHAVAAALAASAVTPLVMARGHRINNIPNLPLVIEDKVEGIEKTRDAVAFLKKFGAYEDVERVANSKTIRPGKAKLRNKRYRLKRGPLFVYSNENVNLVKAVRNVPGVEACNVNRLNLRQLAPGGHLGRFIIWTESAFRSLDKIFGSYRYSAPEKNGYHLHRTSLTNPDIAKIINSDAIQTAIRGRKQNKVLHSKQKKNPLKNTAAMERLNPHSNVLARMDRQANENNRNRRQLALKAKRGISASKSGDEKKESKQRKQVSRAFITNVHKNMLDAYPKKGGDAE
jgi:large subunit ribosomal protein L4e